MHPFSSHIINDIYIANIFLQNLSSVINKIVINIMIIEVMCRAKLPLRFVDSRSRDVIDGIIRPASYIESVKYGGRPRGSTWKQ